MEIQINRKPREIPDGADVAIMLTALNLPLDGVAVAVNGEIVARERWRETKLGGTDTVEIVRMMAGGQDAPLDEPLVIAGRTFTSRLFLGTGKYPTMQSMQESLAASGTEMVTVAIRYMDLDDPQGGDIVSHLDLKRVHLLPNTAGAYTAQDAIRMAHLARAATGTNWIKLEVIGDQKTLLPDLQGTIEAAKQLVKDGFVVLPYTTPDLITALRLEDAGCATIMPLAAMIGSGQGLQDWAGIRRIVERVKLPVVVDAGIGCASDAARAMELGASAVLVNTAIAKAQNPAQMAYAMKVGTEAGRHSYLSGRMPVFNEANASSPTAGVPRATHEVE